MKTKLTHHARDFYDTPKNDGLWTPPKVEKVK